MTLWQFEKAAESLRLRFSEQELASEEIRMTALAELRALGDEAAKRRLARTTPSEAALDHALKGYFPGLASRKAAPDPTALVALHTPRPIGQTRPVSPVVSVPADDQIEVIFHEETP